MRRYCGPPAPSRGATAALCTYSRAEVPRVHDGPELRSYPPFQWPHAPADRKAARRQQLPALRFSEAHPETAGRSTPPRCESRQRRRPPSTHAQSYRGSAESSGFHRRPQTRETPAARARHACGRCRTRPVTAPDDREARRAPLLPCLLPKPPQYLSDRLARRQTQLLLRPPPPEAHAPDRDCFRSFRFPCAYRFTAPIRSKVCQTAARCTTPPTSYADNPAASAQSRPATPSLLRQRAPERQSA